MPWPEIPALGENPNYLSLDGLWTFKLLDNPIDDYLQESPGQESPGLTGFEVPSWALPSFEPVKTGGLADNRINGS